MSLCLYILYLGKGSWNLIFHVYVFSSWCLVTTARQKTLTNHWFVSIIGHWTPDMHCILFVCHVIQHQCSLIRNPLIWFLSSLSERQRIYSLWLWPLLKYGTKSNGAKYLVIDNKQSFRCENIAVLKIWHKCWYISRLYFHIRRHSCNVEWCIVVRDVFPSV